MYTVQAEVPFFTDQGAETRDWIYIFTCGQLETEILELQTARRVANIARGYYVNVRIVKWALDGDRMEVVA